MRTSMASWGEPGALVVLVIWFLCMSSVTGIGACMRRGKTGEGKGKREKEGIKKRKVPLLTLYSHVQWFYRESCAALFLGQVQ